jgi:hypothetical protein
MTQRVWCALAVLVSLVGVLTAAADDPPGKPVEFVQHGGHFEKKDSGLLGEPSFVVFTDRKGFDKVFGVAATMGAKAKFVPKDALDTKIVVATVQRGNKIIEYQVDKATVEGDTLTLAYKTTSKDGGNATYASPLIVSVDKGKIAKVVFVEGGKIVGKVEVPK